MTDDNKVGDLPEWVQKIIEKVRKLHFVERLYRSSDGYLLALNRDSSSAYNLNKKGRHTLNGLTSSNQMWEPTKYVLAELVPENLLWEREFEEKANPRPDWLPEELGGSRVIYGWGKTRMAGGGWPNVAQTSDGRLHWSYDGMFPWLSEEGPKQLARAESPLDRKLVAHLKNTPRTWSYYQTAGVDSGEYIGVQRVGLTSVESSYWDEEQVGKLRGALALCTKDQYEEFIRRLPKAGYQLISSCMVGTTEILAEETFFIDDPEMTLEDEHTVGQLHKHELEPRAERLKAWVLRQHDLLPFCTYAQRNTSLHYRWFGLGGIPREINIQIYAYCPACLGLEK